jgi:hypothetical protein
MTSIHPCLPCNFWIWFANPLANVDTTGTTDASPPHNHAVLLLQASNAMEPFMTSRSTTSPPAQSHLSARPPSSSSPPWDPCHMHQGYSGRRHSCASRWTPAVSALHWQTYVEAASASEARNINTCWIACSSQVQRGLPTVMLGSELSTGVRISESLLRCFWNSHTYLTVA